ncbi:MAG: hypothetical protein PQJ58_05655 [Spirochaetales bacterium]|nr:hypothetical protein [Spirochaetales bacterium]
MNRRLVSVILSGLILLIPFVSVSGEEILPNPVPYENTKLRTASLITGGAVAAGVLTVYAVGPYTGFDFADHPGASALMTAGSACIITGSSLVYSSILARSLYENENTLWGGAFKGAWTGALAGGLANGLSFACMMGIGASSGVIEFNDPEMNGTRAMLTGFAGGFAFGAVYGVILGGLEGAVFSGIQKRISRDEG